MALKTYQRGVNYCIKHGLDENQAWTMGHLAKLQALEGKYEDAIGNLNEGIQIFEELGYEKDVVEFYQSLGDIYLDLGEAQTALESFDKTYSFYDIVNDSLRIVQVVIRQSDAYLLQNNPEQAYSVLEKATPIAEQSGVEANIVTLKKQKARVLSRQQEWGQAGTDGERGTGLGLVLVKELTSLNQGELHIDSQEGKGTAFTVRLPAA